MLMEIKDGLHVILVSEDSKTLNSLLRFCYPCTLPEDPMLEDSAEIVNVLDAVQKCSIGAIQSADECILVARYTLREPLITGWFKEIELITSAELLSLLTCRQECSKSSRL
ncbi:hypothetical protein EDD16DRAFT_205285 [Pisolithus croceorrhizus]|nr:hypothetical protein EDD16DRAFT_205285 [Pisolithus croceorrhizus]